MIQDGRTAARLWLRVNGIVLLAIAQTQAHPAAAPSEHTNADARIAYYRAQAVGPGNYPAFARLGLAYADKARQTGDARFYADALKHLRQSLKYQPNFEALFGLALVFSDQHQFPLALDYAQQAIATMPEHLPALGLLFDIQLALGNLDQAQIICERMLATQRGFDALARLAALSEYRGAYTAAAEAITEAAVGNRLTPAIRAWCEVRLGSLLLAQCRPTEARNAYERALALVPDYFFALEHVAEWHAAQQQWPEAERLYHQLVHQRPDPQYRLAFAEVLTAQRKDSSATRQKNKALKELRRAVRNGSVDVFRPLALLLLEDDETVVEGLRWAERDWELRRDALSADTLGWAYCRNGRYQEASMLSEAALKSGTRAPAIWLHSAVIQLRLGNVAEAERRQQQAVVCPEALSPGERSLSKQVKNEMYR